MEKEISRAEQAINDSKVEESKLQEEIKNLQDQIEEKMLKNKEEVKNAKQKVDLLQSQIEQESHNFSVLHSKLGYITDRLSKIQPSRGRQVTNGRSKK